jgi:hypothetical protein
MLTNGQPATSTNYASLVNITSIGYGYGLSLNKSNTAPLPYTDKFVNFVNITGFKFSLSRRYVDRYGLTLTNCLYAGLGTGYSSYNGGFMVPLFLDIRYFMNYTIVVPYFYGDAGLMLNFDDINHDTRMFMNAGFGATFELSDKIILKAEGGPFLQMGDSKPRDAFFTANLGLIFRFY